MINFLPIEDVYRKEVKIYIQNKNVCKYLSWQPYNNEGKIREYFQYAKNANGYPDEILVIIHEGNCIGTLHILKKVEGVAQIGFGLLPDFWGKGFGNECCIEVLKHIRTTKWKDNIIKVITLIHEENIAAIKIALKNSFMKDVDQTGVKTNYIRYILPI